MTYTYRYFVNGYDTAIASTSYLNKYPPVPAVGNHIYIENDFLTKDYSADWTEEDLDYDYYIVTNVSYDYSEDFVLVDIFLTGMYTD